AAFEAWLGRFVAGQAPDDSQGPLKVLTAPDGHRFMDSRKGFVSVLSLDSVRDLERRLGRPVDAARFRANVLVEGWPAWAEHDQVGGILRLGEVELTVLDDTVRCAATHVDPVSGEKDIDMVAELFAGYGHMCCGVYAEVTGGGRLAVGDPATAPARSR
ncbi:MAG: domain containing protein, partial [Caulobacteraceae bacterium]|nr:domain containing protein [Caulobacteraceae bacterium]